MRLQLAPRFPYVFDFAQVVLLLFVVASPWLIESRPFSAASHALKQIARRRMLALVLTGLFGVCSSAALSLVRPSIPSVHDEFSYLLAADTFAHGRVTNPPHPMWLHFESFHIIQQPTYMSKYPPAQGLMLAAGQVITGRPIVGVWISMGLACATIYWMLLGFVPPRWAFLGGWLAASCLVVGSPTFGATEYGYWGRTYWGGAIAALGGALMFGALPRIMRGPKVRDALLLGFGLAILANSRPMEGLVASLPVAVMLVLWMAARKGPALSLSIKKTAIPLLATLTLTAAAMGYYDLRVTGNAFVFPYTVHETAYAVAPNTLLETPKAEPLYHHQTLRDFYVKLLPRWYQMQRESVSGYMQGLQHKALQLWGFYLGPLLLIPLMAVPWRMRDRWTRFAFLSFGPLFGLILVLIKAQPHYVAPMAALLYLLVMQGMRCLRFWQSRRGQLGRRLVRAIPVLYTARVFEVIAISAVARFMPGLEYENRHFYRHEFPFYVHRQRILDQLEHEEGRHLIIVHYTPAHSPPDEWVWNEADIDRAKVVWAREMDATHNRQLLDYFKDRRVWLLDADQRPANVAPIPWKNCGGQGIAGGIALTANESSFSTLPSRKCP